MNDASLAQDPPVNLQELVGQIRCKATELGFDLVGITSAEPSHHIQYFRHWLADGHAGTMKYLADRFEERTNPATYFLGAQSVICVAKNYLVPLETNSPTDVAPGRIARYALCDDYHEIIKDRLHDLADWLREIVPGTKTRSGVDTVPVLERELAARAGIGWIGKNTCVIHPEIGSWILLGEIITTLPLPTDEPSTDHCGTCTRCIDACPTAAIVEPYKLDARRCISYLTIEHREKIADEFHRPIGDWIYGCDICQDVCPFNRKAPPSTDAAFNSRFPTGTLDAEKVLNWTESDYRETLRGSAMKRVKLPLFKRNAEIVRRNYANDPPVT